MASSARPSWHLLSLRPQGRHEALRAAAGRHGGGLIALSICRLDTIDDPSSRARLAAALATGRVIFTSPAAVSAANALSPLSTQSDLHALAVGAGTASALRRAGVAQLTHPSRMDSEGLLDLPVLQDVVDRDLGLVTAPGGRGTLQPALEARGARVLRANVYQRSPIAPTARSLQALQELDGPAAVAISSSEAMSQLLRMLPADLARKLRGLPAVASSARLAALARRAGFVTVSTAAGPRPAQLAAAARDLLSR